MSHHSTFQLFAVLVITAAISSCGTVMKASLSSDPVQTEAISRQSETTPAYLIFQNGDTFSGYRVGIRSDSTEWYETDSTGSVSEAVRYTAPTSDIVAVSVATPNIGRGILSGAGNGALLGTLIWAAAELTHSIGNSDAPAEDQLGNALVRGIGFPGWAIGLGTVGAVAGIFQGQHYRTEYENGANDKNAGLP